MNCWYSSPGPRSRTYGLFSICINVVYHLLSPPDPVCASLPKIASWNNTWITFPIQKFQWFLHPSRKKTKLLAHKAFQSQNSNGFSCSHLSLHQPTCHPFLHLNSSVCLCRERFNLSLPPKSYSFFIPTSNPLISAALFWVLSAIWSFLLWPYSGVLSLLPKWLLIHTAWYWSYLFT